MQHIQQCIKRILTPAILAVAIAFMGASPAASAETATDCDTNAVIYCGAQSTSQVVDAYQNGVKDHNTAKSIQDIYTYFKISASTVSSLSSTAAAGHVNKDGSVYVDSSTKAVATNAVTAGRGNIAGSTQVTSGSTTFYTRPPSVSFRSTSLPAFVVMQDGTFKFAIIESCGNPVKATPVPKPVPPKPTPAPVTPTTTPTPTPTPQPTPSPAPTPPVPVPVSTPVVPATAPPVVVPVVEAVAATPTALVNTGPGPVLAIALVATVSGVWFYRRRLINAARS